MLVSLASARRIGELQALSNLVSFTGDDIHLTYLPEFRAETELEANPLPRTLSSGSLKILLVNSLRSFRLSSEGS